MRFIRKRVAMLAATGILAAVALAGLALSSAPAAHAASGNQWCDTGGWCFNAKSYGPFVDAWGYCQSSGCSANDFTFIGNPGECNNGYTTSTCPGHGIGAGYAIGAVEFVGGGSWNGNCIGDAYNLSNRADASLDQCPSGGSGGGYGTNMVYLTSPGNTCGSGYVLLYDIHWNGYVRWAGDSNGSTVYLNNSNGYCLHLLPGA